MVRSLKITRPAAPSAGGCCATLDGYVDPAGDKALGPGLKPRGRSGSVTGRRDAPEEKARPTHRGKNEARRSAWRSGWWCDLRRLNRMHATPEESIRIEACPKKEGPRRIGAASPFSKGWRPSQTSACGGSTVSGLHHLIWEVVDNTDRRGNGYATTVNVVLLEWRCRVADDGPRHSVHPPGALTVDVVLAQLHAGGKFRLGRHGIYCTASCRLYHPARSRDQARRVRNLGVYEVGTPGLKQGRADQKGKRRVNSAVLKRCFHGIRLRSVAYAGCTRD